MTHDLLSFSCSSSSSCIGNCAFLRLTRAGDPHFSSFFDFFFIRCAVFAFFAPFAPFAPLAPFARFFPALVPFPK